MRPVWLTIGLALASCSNGGELLGTVASDAGKPDAGLGAFSAPTLLSSLSSSTNDQDPTFPADELDIFFMSDRGGTNDIWTSRRLTKDADWPAPVPVNELNSPAKDEDPGISADGLSVWFVSDREGGLKTLWTSVRASRNAPWDAPTHVAELDASSNLRAPAVDEGELTLAFVVEQGPSGGSDILITSRASVADPWQAPAPLTGIDTPNNDWDPWLGARDLEVFWADDSRQINQGFRSSVAAPWMGLTPVPGIDTPAGDPTLSLDLRHIVFSSDRAGTYDLYEAFR